MKKILSFIIGFTSLLGIYFIQANEYQTIPQNVNELEFESGIIPETSINDTNLQINKNNNSEDEEPITQGEKDVDTGNTTTQNNINNESNQEGAIQNNSSENEEPITQEENDVDIENIADKNNSQEDINQLESANQEQTTENPIKKSEELTRKINSNTESNTYELTTFQKAFQEVAYAYYMRGPYIHYNVAKGIGNIISPEESTSQDYHHMACALYAMNIYKELLGIDLSPSDVHYANYANKYKGERKEVIGYGELQTSGVDNGSLYWYDGTKNENGERNIIKDPSQSYVISQLRVGDILEQNGHVMLVYDYVFDEDGNVVDVYLINSTSSNYYRSMMKAGHETSAYFYDQNDNYQDLRLAYAPRSNLFFSYRDRRGIYEESRIEGTILLETFTERANRDGILLFDKMNSKNKYKEFYSILRFVDTDEEGNSVLNFDGSYTYFSDATQNEEINDQIIDYSDSVQSRLKYSKLYIEKTVDKKDNNIVEPSDELTYKILIKNESNLNYEDDLIVKENIDTNLVENLGIYNYTKNGTQTNEIQLLNNGNQLQWNIGELDSGDEITIEYTVKVKEGNVGKTIESTGMVDNIPSGTVKNKIGLNLKEQYSSSIGDKYEELKTQYTGKILINEIYKEVYGIDLGLNNLEILTNNSESENGLIYFNNKWGSWSYYGNKDFAKMYINKNDTFSGMVLNSYFNTLYKSQVKRTSLNGINITLYSIPGIWIKENNPDNRANTIYPTDFKTGDILIYTNTNDIKYSIINGTHNTKENIITYEDGEYVYIYIDGKFVGVNLGNDGELDTLDDRNEFTKKYYEDNELNFYNKSAWVTSATLLDPTDELKEFLHYQTLFGKDAYVILRPSLAIRNINYELNGGINNEDNPGKFVLGSNIKLKEPTKSGFVSKGWYTDSGYTNQVNNINELTDDSVLYAKRGCEEGFHLSGSTCVSNTKKENCIPGTIANGNYTVEKVDVIRNTSTNEWNATPPCTNFTCNINYHKDGNLCMANVDENGNGTADEEEPHHNLTIHYIDSKDRTVFDDYSASIVQGASYTVTSQEKLHYTADTPIVSGIMGDKDITITVKYSTATADTNNNGIADEDENKYTLTINYVYSRGGEVSQTVTGEYLEGILYSVTSPVITYYSANVEVVEGVMPGEDKTIIVTYTPVNDRNKNGIADEKEKNNYSGGGGHGGSNNSSTSNKNSNQHGSTDKNPEKVKENEMQGNEEIKTVGNTTKTQNEKDKITVPAQVFTYKLWENSNGNGSDILNNGYSREVNNAYQFSYKNGITTVNSIDKAKMDSPLTRIVMSKMLSNYAINILGKQPDTSKGIPKFNDVTDKQNSDYGNAVTLAYQLGIMGQNMKNNNFRPNDVVSRAELATALSRLLYGTKDGNDKYYTTHLKKLKEKGIITKDNPSIREKRSNLMLMLMRTVG